MSVNDEFYRLLHAKSFLQGSAIAPSAYERTIAGSHAKTNAYIRTFSQPPAVTPVIGHVLPIHTLQSRMPWLPVETTSSLEIPTVEVALQRYTSFPNRLLEMQGRADKVQAAARASMAQLQILDQMRDDLLMLLLRRHNDQDDVRTLPSRRASLAFRRALSRMVTAKANANTV